MRKDVKYLLETILDYTEISTVNKIGGQVWATVKCFIKPFKVVLTINLTLKSLANEDTLLWTHSCRHKCFPACPRAQHLLWTQNFVSGTQKNVSDFVQKHFVSAKNVSQFAQPKKRHGQQCVRNNVSLFARAFTNFNIHTVIMLDQDFNGILLTGS